MLSSLPKAGIAFVMDCAVDFDTSKKAIALAEQYDFMYAAAGIHPQSLLEGDKASTQTQFGGDWRAEMAAIAPLYDHPKVLAVGEVGLDHYWPVPRDAQIEMFEAEIKTAMERDLPLIIHDREAHEEMYRLLKKYKPRGVMHAFSGSAEDVKWLCAQGLFIGFTGKITYKNVRHPLEAAAAVPNEFLVLETDCPYMAPEPFRGKDSDSTMIPYTAAVIAKVRGVTVEELLPMTLENGKRLFGV